MDQLSVLKLKNENYNIQYNKKGRIKIGCKNKRYEIIVFLISITLLALAGLYVLDIDWIKIFSRIQYIGDIFLKLIKLDFSQIDIILSSFLETVTITVLATIYSLVLGIVFGMLAANNIYKVKGLSTGIKTFFTFLRAIPTPVWVLLMLVCLGMGPEAGIAGLVVHSTAFFTKAFSQSFENIPLDTISALESTGASKIQIFMFAILISSLSEMIAWIGIRFEVNFGECAILGMVGAGGIGYVISTSIQGYEYGTAGLAILLVVTFAYFIERLFVKIKRKIK